MLSGKQYRGKCDRVAVYQYLTSEWKKTPILKKKPMLSSYNKSHLIFLNKEEEINKEKTVNNLYLYIH